METRIEKERESCCAAKGCPICEPEMYEYTKCNTCHTRVLRKELNENMMCDYCYVRQCAGCGKIVADEIMLSSEKECPACQRLNDKEFEKIFETAIEIKKMFERFKKKYIKLYGIESYYKFRKEDK